MQTLLTFVTVPSRVSPLKGLNTIAAYLTSNSAICESITQHEFLSTILNVDRILDTYAVAWLDDARASVNNADDGNDVSITPRAGAFDVGDELGTEVGCD